MILNKINVLTVIIHKLLKKISNTDNKCILFLVQYLTFQKLEKVHPDNSLIITKIYQTFKIYSSINEQ